MTIQSDASGHAVQAAKPALSQSVAVGASSAASAAFSTNPNLSPFLGTGSSLTPNHTAHIRLVSTTACWVSFGSPPAAAVVRDPASMYLPAGLPEYFWVTPGSQVAVIQDTAAGFLYVTELVNN